MKQTLNAATVAATLLVWSSLCCFGGVPANDLFANRTTLTGGYATLTLNNTGATVETGEPKHGGSGGPFHSVWWTWTAPYSGPVEINTQGSVIDTVLAVYTNKTASANYVTDLATLASNDDSSPGTSWSRVAFRATAGVAYQIAVDGYNKYSTGNLTLTLRMGPSAVVTAPLSGFAFTAPATITITAAAAAVTGSVTRVEFFQGTAKLGQLTSPPYSLAWNNVEVGDYTLTVQATDSAGVSNVSPAVPITVSSSVPPAVNLVSPAANSSYVTPVDLTLTAATMGQQVPNTVQFYANGLLLGGASATPYSFVWNSAPPGYYDLMAVASYASELAVTSPPVPIRVENSLVRLSGLTDGQTLAGPLDLALTALASDTTTVVEFFADTLKLGETTNRPFNQTWSQAPLGHHTLWAVANTTGGLRATSAPVRLLIAPNQAPAVAITSPANATQFLEPTAISLTAGVADADGAVRKVEFFANGAKLGESLTGPFSLVWSNPLPGNYQITGVATDNLGAVGTSAPIRLKVALVLDRLWTAINDQQQGPVSSPNDTFYTLGSLGTQAGALRNIDTGVPLPVSLLITNNSGVQATATMSAPAPGTPAYNHFAGYVDWNSAGSPNNGYQIYPANTVGCLFSGLDTNKAYRFTATSVRGGTTPSSGNEYSNRWTRAELVGALSYLPTHSTNVLTSNQYAGALNGSQAAFNAGVNSTTTTGDVVQWDKIVPGPGGTFTVLCTHYRGPIPGGNAVNSQYSFGFSALRLEEFAAGTTLVRITSPANEALVALPGPVVVTALTAGFEQPVTNVAFYAGSLWLGDALFPPFSLSWTTATPGTHFLTAVGTDASGLSVTSAPVRIIVQDGTPPTVASFFPPPGLVTNFTQLTVTFSEPVSGVDAGDLWINDSPALRVQGSEATHTFTFAMPPAGPVRITWSEEHAITDREVPAKPFNGTLPHEVAQYNNIDTVAPTVATLSPAPGSRVRSLDRVVVFFREQVSGVKATDLLINGQPANRFNGSMEGPYVFFFDPPPEGTVRVAWAPDQTIHDLASPPNAFAGGSWTYQLNSNAIAHVVHISLDGLGAAYLMNYVTNAPDFYPNFVRLKNQGAWTLNARCDYTYSITLPNHASMFTSRPVDQPAGWPNTSQHGVHTDSDSSGRTIHDADIGNPNVPYKASVFDVVHDNGLSTAFLYTKASLTLFVRSWDATHGQANTNGQGKIDFNLSTAGGSSYGPTAPIVDEFVARVQTNGLWNYTFMHFDDPDATGHASGWGSPTWSNAIITVDQQLGRVMDALASSPTYANQTVLMVTADHGGGGFSSGGHGEANYYTNYVVPLFLWGVGIPANVDLYTLFADRADPGPERPDYNVFPQPLRNGDTGNLALAFLGLSPIPGSGMLPILAGTGPFSLTIAQAGTNVTVSWPANAAGYQLQAATAFGQTTSWQTLSNGITPSGTLKTFTFTPAPSQPTYFFRLKKN